MSLRSYILLLVILFLALAPAHAVAAGQVSGGVLYGAGQYQAEVDGKESQKIASQYGQLSVKYQAQRTNGRLGKYTLMLGYEFNILDPTFINMGVKDPTFERIETGKVLYRGEILVAPGGLPFRLSAYARDVTPSSLIATTRGTIDLPVGLQGGRQSRRTLITPDIVTEIDNGTQREVGATLLLGIRNGSYLGAYRDILSQLPRLLIDYKQVEVRDLAQDANRQHYRERDLAFISLNKKDNWVHFRTHDYTDYLDATQDFETRQVMIGTVDQLMTRQWINLTNWIQISGDLSYTVEKRRNEEAAENAYRVNLLANLQRQDFKSTLLSSFERLTAENRLTHDLDIPLYFAYAQNRDSHYRGSLRTTFYRQSYMEGHASESSPWGNFDRDVTFDLGSEFFRTRAIVFKPRIMLGVREDDSSQGVSEKLTLEWSSRRGDLSLPWTAGYYVASAQTSNESHSSVFLEQSLYGSVEKSLNRALRVGGTATLRKGSGQSNNDVTEDLSADLEIGDSSRGFTKAEIKRFLSYSGLVFGEHAGERFSNRIELNAEGIKSDVEDLVSMEVRHILMMAARMSKFSLTSAFSRGSSVSIQSINTEYNNEPSTTAADFGWSSKAEYSYMPDRRLLLTLLCSAKSLSEDGENNTLWLGSEKLEYRFYKSTGIVRKIAEISEELGAEGGGESLSGRDRTIFLRTAAAVYPTKYFYAKVASELVMFKPVGSEQMTLNAETGAIFEKLQVALSYSRGYKTAELLLPDVKEERWDVKVRKTF